MSVYTLLLCMMIEFYTSTNCEALDTYTARLREGRHEISSGDNVETVACTRTYHMNDVIVKTDQDLGTLAVALLEPSGEGSLFLWGFFSSVLTTHEQFENYIMVPLALKMLEESDDLAEEWEIYKSENPSYDNATEATLSWFWKRSAFYEEEAYLYPVGIMYDEPVDDIPLAPFTSQLEAASAKGQPNNSGHTLATVSAWAIVPMFMWWFLQM